MNGVLHTYIHPKMSSKPAYFLLSCKSQFLFRFPAAQGRPSAVPGFDLRLSRPGPEGWDANLEISRCLNPVWCDNLPTYPPTYHCRLDPHSFSSLRLGVVPLCDPQGPDWDRDAAAIQRLTCAVSSDGIYSLVALVC
jgi:hypothetical protein